jgi:hypothetical protein
MADHRVNPSANIDTTRYEDSLILFMIRLMQLQAKRHHKEYRPPEVKMDWDGDFLKSAELIEPNVDPDAFISYLSLVRQFWLNDDAVSIHRIRGILRHAARISHDDALEARIKERERKFRQGSHCSYVFCDGDDAVLVDQTQDDLVNFWFHTAYFHTKLDTLDTAIKLIQTDALNRSRRWFEVVVHAFVEYVQEYAKDVLTILWKGLFPPGQLHQLLKMYVPLETYLDQMKAKEESDLHSD